MSAQEYFEALMSRHTKLQARGIIEHKLVQLEAKMDKHGFTPEELVFQKSSEGVKLLQ